VKDLVKWVSMTLTTALVVGGTAFGVVVAWGMLQSGPDLDHDRRPAAAPPVLTST
jgi:hypothetical protein